MGVGAFKYLGANIGESPRSIFLLESTNQKGGIEVKILGCFIKSMASRLVLIKSSLDSHPTYWINLYKIPTAVIGHLEQARRSFLWGSKSVSGSQRKTIHLLNWDKVCRNKQDGGLELTSLKLKNTSLLAKWLWRSYSERDKLWNKLLQKKYGKQFNFIW